MSDAPERIWLSAPDEVWFEDGEGRTEYTRSDIAERQIAELRAELEANPRWQPKAEELAVKLVAAEAENARLRALPLKDEVERVLEIARGYIVDDVKRRPVDYDPSEDLERLDALLSRIRAEEQEGWRERAVCDVLTMGHSSGFPDHFARITCGDRSLTAYMSKIKGRCEYHTAEFDWLLNGANKPNILAFDYSEPKGLAGYLKSIAVKDILDKLAEHTNLELSWGAHPDDDTEACWQVHRVNGGRNDREWTLVGVGNTPREALYAALPASPPISEGESRNG